MLDINLTHEQQQKAVEQIQELMAQGMSSGEAIQIVAKALREIHQKGEKEALIVNNKNFCDQCIIFKVSLLHKKIKCLNIFPIEVIRHESYCF